MGNKNCTSSKSEFFLDIFENCNQNRSQSNERKVRQEYLMLKDRLLRMTEVEEHLYPMKNYDKPQNQIAKFKKWLSMSNFGSVEGDQEEQVKKKTTRSKLKVTESESLNELKKKLDDISSIITPSSKKKINFDDYSSKSEVTHSNYLEFNLRDYHQLNKLSFLDKLYKGPPVSFRFLAWLIAAETPFVRIDELFFCLINETIEERSDDQIQKDLSRTYSHVNNCFNYADTRIMLYNLLKAISLQDSEVGYCQGMNFIAGFLLIISDFNQVDSFYVMIGLLSKTFSNHMGIRGFFVDGFPLLRLCMYQFEYILEDMLPKLSALVKELEVPNEVWISKWFQTLFTICLPIDMTVRVWDCFFVEGFPFLFSFTIAMLRKFESDLLMIDDIVDFVDFFKIFEPNYKVKKNIEIEAIIFESKSIKVTPEYLNKLREDYERENKITLSDFEIKYKLDYDFSFVNEACESLKSDFFKDKDNLADFDLNLLEQGQSTKDSKSKDVDYEGWKVNR